MWLQDFIDPNRFRTWHPPWFNEARLRESLRLAFERHKENEFWAMPKIGRP